MCEAFFCRIAFDTHLSAPREIRLPFFEERGNAFAPIFRAARGILFNLGQFHCV
jgi:hypothetical protein